MSALRTVELFAQDSERLTLKAGDVIFQHGSIGRVMYGLLAGTVDLQVSGRTVEVIEAGDVFGEGALVQIEHRRASTAIAKTDCELIELSERRFKFLIEQTPMFALDIMRSFSDRLYKFKHSQLV